MSVLRLISNLGRGNSKQWDDLQPISAEIFGVGSRDRKRMRTDIRKGNAELGKLKFCRDAEAA